MKRIQRKRVKGWKMPPGCKYVGRPTIWGNPYKAPTFNRDSAVAAFRAHMNFRLSHPQNREYWRGELEKLRGHDLACFCPIDLACHADVLLELLEATKPQ